MAKKQSTMLAKSIGLNLRRQLQLQTGNSATAPPVDTRAGKFFYSAYMGSKCYYISARMLEENCFLCQPSFTTTSQLHCDEDWFDAAVQRVMNEALAWAEKNDTAVEIHKVVKNLDPESLDIFLDFLEEQGISDAYDEMSPGQMQFVLKEIKKYESTTSGSST